jgi:23S rRNA (adenine2503-C2)-methyltransferase
VIHLLQLSPAELAEWFSARGEPAYRARQVRQWLFERRAGAFDEMTDLPRRLREQLAANFSLWASQIVSHQQADDGTEKLLLQLSDGHTIECVLLRAEDGRRTVCVSTQVGCAMGCVFCASGLDGVVRNLTHGEILEQCLRLNRLLGGEERLSHVVVMGMGEPLANLDGLLPALAEVSSPTGLGISVRRITISTVGLPEAIRRLADSGCAYRLAVSLHAPEDRLRDELVPVNRRIGLSGILEAVDYFFQRTGRRVTFEYVLLGGLNDGPQHARELAALLRGRNALVNLIPYNPVAGLRFRRPSAEAVVRFAGLLEEGGVRTKVRYRRGDKIDAACGQLRRSHALQGTDAAPAARGSTRTSRRSG